MLKVAITGSTGLVGPKIIDLLLRENYAVTQISRQEALKGDVQTPLIVWDPARGQLDSNALEGFDIIIHLAGTNVGDAWSPARKKSILDSRVNGTRLLSRTIASLKQKPKLLICASAIGYYGNCSANDVLDEGSPKGQGFLPDVCWQWEFETKPAQEAGVRVVHMRIGVVLSKAGGALAKMWMPFQLGLGGVLGHGRQMLSWVALDEIPSIISFIIKNEKIAGPVNVVAPNPVSNREFTKVLGKVINRPVIFPVPGFAIRMLFGEMGQSLLLEGSKVLPKKLLDAGYRFKYPDIGSALEKAVL